MEDRKSGLYNNQVENCKKDFQFINSVFENGDSSEIKHYERDALIQLRLHPLSLQKPQNLPDIEVIKDRLYLHTAVDSSSPADKCVDQSTYQNSLKSDYCNMKHEYPFYPHYFNRLYPYSFPHMYNGPYQNASSKLRSAFHTYCSPLKKPCVTNHSSYKKISEEGLWAKQCYMSSEDIWNCYPNHVNANYAKSKENVDDIPKTRKKLPIIDPVTGKNVLEAVTANSSETQSDVFVAEESSEFSENCNADVTEKYAGDYFYDARVMDGTTSHNFSEFSKDVVSSYAKDKMYNEKFKIVDTMYQAEYTDKKLEDECKFEETSDNTSALTANHNQDVDSSVGAMLGVATSTVDSTGAAENVYKIMKSDESIKSASEVDNLLNKQIPKALQTKEIRNPADIHGNCLAYCKKGNKLQTGKETVPKESDFIRDGLKQLREKINSLTQEQQKMTILQSFLRYKKYKLEETARNLDEKRIEIANWECNLLKKAKRLFDKEQWLDNRNEKLQNKTQELDEYEKILNKVEGKEVSQEFHNFKSDHKESQFPERKFLLDNCSDTAWNEIPVKNIYRGEDNDEYTYFTRSSTPNIISKSSSNVEKCESDASSLDELEKNIIFIEKMNVSGETNNSSFESKTEHVSLNVIQKKDDSACCDTLGYSKGRRYLPEHIKYWLNKRDKNAL